jgi:hypothetical protein
VQEAMQDKCNKLLQTRLPRCLTYAGHGTKVRGSPSKPAWSVKYCLCLLEASHRNAMSRTTFEPRSAA